jgi:hypothetical protein
MVLCWYVEEGSSIKLALINYYYYGFGAYPLLLAHRDELNQIYTP